MNWKTNMQQRFYIIKNQFNGETNKIDNLDEERAFHEFNILPWA